MSQSIEKPGALKAALFLFPPMENFHTYSLMMDFLRFSLHGILKIIFCLCFFFYLSLSLSDVLALPIFKQEDTSLPSENETKNPPFQYVLCAATSPAVKLHDETLTYLNQGEREAPRSAVLNSVLINPQGEIL